MKRPAFKFDNKEVTIQASELPSPVVTFLVAEKRWRLEQSYSLRTNAHQITKAAPAGEAITMPHQQDAAAEFTRRARLSWAKLIHRVYEVDPLLCPFCGAEMKVLAFILDFATASAIRRSLELPAQEPEPLAHAPPETLELIAETA